MSDHKLKEFYKLLAENWVLIGKKERGINSLVDSIISLAEHELNDSNASSTLPECIIQNALAIKEILKHCE